MSLRRHADRLLAALACLPLLGMPVAWAQVDPQLDSRDTVHVRATLDSSVTRELHSRSTTRILAATATANSRTDVFEWVWERLLENLYDRARANRLCTEAARARLRREMTRAQTLDDAGLVLNRFLDTLGISHTGFYTGSDLEYGLFRSMFVTKDLDDPKVWHIGMQHLRSGGGAIVRAVWDGLPAHRAGLRRGDVVRAANGKPFRSLASFENRQAVRLQVARNDSVLEFEVEPIHEAAHRSLQKAMQRSVRILDIADHRIGYVHLWTGTSATILHDFRNIIETQLAGVAGILLDLRDGFGGAWQDYLDPFFADRADYFHWTVRDRDGKSSRYEPDSTAAHACFSGPMVVLVNEGTRSGSEALAYQFKKSRRALLVGTSTAGAFAGGRVFFPREGDYALYVAVLGIELDGQQIEGVGIAPDVEVDYPLVRAPAQDPQLARAIAEMRTLVERH